MKTMFHRIAACTLVLALLQTTASAAFDFGVVSNLPAGNSGTLTVSVNNTGATASSLSSYQIPLVFGGPFSSISLDPPSGVLGPFGPTPSVTNSGGRAVVTSFGFGSIPLPTGVTTIFTVPFTLLGGNSGTVAIDSSPTGTNGFDGFAAFDGGGLALAGAGAPGGPSQLTAVPEPSSFLFLGLAASIGFGVRKYRERKQAA